MKCWNCGNERALLLLNTLLCPNKSCKNYDEGWAKELEENKDTKKLKLELEIEELELQIVPFASNHHTIVLDGSIFGNTGLTMTGGTVTTFTSFGFATGTGTTQTFNTYNYYGSFIQGY